MFYLLALKLFDRLILPTLLYTATVEVNVIYMFLSASLLMSKHLEAFCSKDYSLLKLIVTHIILGWKKEICHLATAF